MKTYSPELKAQVIGEWQLGTPKAAIARKFNVSRAYVQQVTRDLPKMAVLSSEKREDLGALIFDYIGAALRALTVQADLAGDREWLKAWLKDDPAAGFHQLHGTIADKVISVVAGIHRDDAQEDA